ncbi:MAG: hypothetical protein V1830_03090 [Candidatus Omnitrophota bacterium]
MSKRLWFLFFAAFIMVNFYGCTTIPGAIPETQKQLKLTWNVSYLRGLVLVKEALKAEPLQFGNALITKDAAKLKGSYADGRTVQIVISKISKSESSVAVNLGSSQSAREDEKKILEAIAQYSKKNK